MDGLLLESSVNVIVRRELQHHPRLHAVLASIDEVRRASGYNKVEEERGEVNWNGLNFIRT